MGAFINRIDVPGKGYRIGVSYRIGMPGKISSRYRKCMRTGRRGIEGLAGIDRRGGAGNT